AEADRVRTRRTDTRARRLRLDGTEESVAAGDLAKGDVVVCKANDVIPSDGEIIDGAASVDESAITGESAPVTREAGGDRSAVTGGDKGVCRRRVGWSQARGEHTSRGVRQATMAAVQRAVT